MTHHNIAFMMNLMKDIRNAISRGAYKEFVHDFVRVMFPDSDNKVSPEQQGHCYSGKNAPKWAKMP